MGILTVDSQYMQRKHKRVQFDVLVSRAADEPFVSVGQIDGELDGFITIQSLKAEGSQTFANSEGFNNIIRFSVATQSLLDNTSIFNIETIDKGLWYVQFKEVYGTINFVTPFPVSLKITAGIRTGNHKSQSTLIETFFYTTDLDWIKDSRPPTPLLIKPDKLATGNPPHPPSQTIDLSNGITFRLSNPAVKPILQELTLYDIRIYSDALRQNEVASKLNLTKSQIIDADYVATSNTELTGFSNLQRGVKYYVRIIAKYLGLESPPLDFAIAFGFTAPSLSDYPSSIEYPTNTAFQVTAQRVSVNANANQVEFEWRIGVDGQGIVSAAYNNSGVATVTFQLQNISTTDPIFVKARSRNSIVIGEWSDEIQISVTLFRPTPQVLLFTASSQKVALQASPTETVRLSFIASYEDLFGGWCTWRIVRTDNNLVIGSGVQMSPTFSGSANFDIGNTVTSHNPISFRLVIIRPDGVEFNSLADPITVTFVSRPDVSKARVFFNPNENVFSDDAATTPATADGAVAVWKTSNPNSVYPQRTLRQPNSGNRPLYRAVPATQTLPTVRYYIESNGSKWLSGIENESYLPPLGDSKRDKITMMVFGFSGGGGNGELVQAGNSNPFYRLSFAASNGSDWEFTFINTSHGRMIYNANSALALFVMTFTRNTANGTKLFRSDIAANNTTPVATSNAHANDFANGVSQPHLNLVAQTLSGGVRRVGHIIIFEDTDISTDTAELQRWYNWFKAIYKV